MKRLNMQTVNNNAAIFTANMSELVLIRDALSLYGSVSRQIQVTKQEWEEAGDLADEITELLIQWKAEKE